MNCIIKIIKSLEDSDVLIDRVTKTLKYEVKKQKGRFLGALLAPLTASIMQPVITSVVKGISKRGVLIPLHSLINNEINNYLNYVPRFNGVFQEIIYLE